MNNLIKAELFKLKRTKVFWVLTLIVIGLSALLHYLVIIDWWYMSGTSFEKAGLSEMNASAIFTVPLFFNLIISTLAGFFISVEFSQSGVIKNQVMSGHKRSHIFIAKYLIYSIGSVLVTILIPLVIVIVEIVLLGHGDLLNMTNLLYLGRAYALFTIQFLGYTAIIAILAILTEDSGKTIIISILFTIVMYFIDMFPKPLFIKMLYEHSIFYQFSHVFTYTMTDGELIKSILIGIVTLIIMMFCGLFIFNRKEIK